MAVGRSASSCALALLLAVSFTGCLGDDIWREPYVWRPAGSFGDNPDAAQALAVAFANLAQQAEDQGGIVVETVRDLPQNVVFQNAREFLDQQTGLGGDVHAAVVLAANTTSDAYVALTGAAAAAYDAATGPIFSPAVPLVFVVPDRTTRLRWTLDVVLGGDVCTRQDQGQNPTPACTMRIRIIDPRGAVRAVYDMDTTRHVDDQLVEGTFGDRNGVRGHLGGAWRVEVDANAEGAWSLQIEAYQPEYDDWRFWQFWRADRREVTGE